MSLKRDNLIKEALDVHETLFRPDAFLKQLAKSFVADMDARQLTGDAEAMRRTGDELQTEAKQAATELAAVDFDAPKKALDDAIARATHVTTHSELLQTCATEDAKDALEASAVLRRRNLERARAARAKARQ